MGKQDFAWIYKNRVHSAQKTVQAVPHFLVGMCA